MTSKFLTRAIYVLFFLVFFSGFEWVNISDQLGDQSFLETAIQVDNNIKPKEKTIAYQQVHQIEKEMSMALIFVKILLSISIVLLVYCFYKNEKLAG